MVHKASARPRGRPRGYDPETALRQATEAFWRHGYAATSLEQLGEATGLNRPSLYHAFGDKRALYLKALRRYVDWSAAATEAALDRRASLAQGLRRFYEGALQLYRVGEPEVRGCFVVGTALTESTTDDGIRALALEGMHAIATKLEARFADAVRAGELPPRTDAAALAQVALAILHSLAARARAGESRAALEALIEAALATLCGSRHSGKFLPLRRGP